MSGLVYVVDDDRDTRETLVAILAADEIAGKAFDTGTSALAAAQSVDAPDVVLLAVRLSDMMGIDLAAALRAGDADVSVLLLTAYTITESPIAAVGLVDAYLTKPVEPDEFLSSVQAALERTRFRRASRALFARLGETAPADLNHTHRSPSPVVTHRHVNDSPMPKALLVEDLKVNQVVATAMLERLGYDVDLASDGRGAIEAAQSTRYDVILMDCLMPIMDGYEAAASIRGLDGPARDTHIIALTSADTVDDRQKCMAAGMDDFIAKPINPTALKNALAAHGNHWPSMTALGRKEAALLRANLTPGERVLGQVIGRFRQAVVATDKKVIVIKTGVLAAQALGGKATTFDYRNIGAVEVRTAMWHGEMEIINDSSPSTQGNHNRDKLKVSESPHGVIFRKSAFDPFQQFASRVREKVASFYSTPNVSIPDQIHQLAELRAVGHLTEDEFSAKKTELLKRM